MIMGWYAERPCRSLQPASSVFHADCWLNGPGAGSASCARPLSVIFGIASPLGGYDACASSHTGAAKRQSTEKKRKPKGNREVRRVLLAGGGVDRWRIGFPPGS